MEKLFLTTVSFTGYNRRLKKYYLHPFPVMRYECEKRISEMCSTAIIHEIKHWEANLLNIEEISKPILNGFKVVLEEEID